MTSRIPLIAAALAFSVATPVVGASAEAGSERLDRCLKSVNLIGASVGHKVSTGTDGKAMLDFIVRSNGAEYAVKCDGDTGVVKDVTAHVRGDSQTN